MEGAVSEAAHAENRTAQIHTLTWRLRLVGDDAAYEVRVRGAQVCHEFVQIFLKQEKRKK